MLAGALALLAASLNAAASVLQRRAGSRQPDRRVFSPRLILALLRQPVWFLGIAAITAGFAAQAGALALGTIAVVQPMLVVELPLTLLLASATFRVRPGRVEASATLVLTVGLILFIYALAPGGGDPLGASSSTWLIGLAATSGVAAVLVALGRRAVRHRRAALLGAATGVGFGLTAVLTAAAGAAAAHGPVAVLTTWQTYALLVVGPLSFLLLQTALQAGSLVASQPGLTLANPLVAVTWGVAVFDEHTRGGGWALLAALGAALVVAGTVALTRSPVLSGGSAGTSSL